MNASNHDILESTRSGSSSERQGLLEIYGNGNTIPSKGYHHTCQLDYVWHLFIYLSIDSACDMIWYICIEKPFWFIYYTVQ